MFILPLCVSSDTCFLQNRAGTIKTDAIQKESMPSGVVKFFKGFTYAWAGICTTFSERNMQFHGLATIAVLVIGGYVGLSKQELMIILMLIALVWSAEMVNTAIEELANTVQKTEGLAYSVTRRTRDIAAGSVLIIAIIAAIIGLIIFVPKFT